MDIAEIQDELLRLEYPNLMPDHDPDIERYYYLRSMGQSRDAMAIYQNRLRFRYPEDQFRTWLLRAYRSHDPAFRGLLARGYRMLGARSLERVKGVIETIADLTDSFNEKDVYSTIKTVESILQFLPKERYEAIAGMDRFARYANVLNLRIRSIFKAAELVRAYLTDSLLVVEEERRRRTEALRRMEEDERQRLVKADWDSYYYQKKFGFRPGSIDLSAVVFSPEDIARVEIPYFSRVEDQVLAYCIKYWNSVEDPAFERILFLYSRKYGKKNYEVFTAIRRGQQAKRRDDEILASVMSLLVTGYYYSIQGDIYLQRNWNAVKNALILQKANRVALPAPKTPAKAATRRVEAQAGDKTKAAKKQKAAKQKTRIILRAKPKSAFKIAPKPLKPVRPAAVAVARPANEPPRTSKSVSLAPVKTPYKLKPASQTKTTIFSGLKTEKKPVIPPRPPVQPKPAIQPAAQPKPPAKPAVAKPFVAAARQEPPTKPAVVKPAAKPFFRVVQPKPAVTPVAAKPVTPEKARKPLVKRPAAKPAQLALIKTQIQPKIDSKPAVTPMPKRPAAKPAAASTPYRFAPYVTSTPSSSSRSKSKVFSNKTLGKAKGSVSDRLKQLSGRSYDVYEDRFLSKARTSIRKILGSGKGLFFSLPEEAEDLVYNFLRDHYSDPYMDWEASSDRKNLQTMGFDLPSIHPVIDECFRAL